MLESMDDRHERQWNKDEKKKMNDWFNSDTPEEIFFFSFHTLSKKIAF